MIFGFLPQNLKTKAAAVAFSMAWRGSEVELRAGDAGRARGRLAAFRGELYRCLTARGDALFGLVDAVLCSDGPVRVLAGLSLVPGHRRGHGAVYDALSAGRVDVPRLRWAVGAVPLPAWPDGRIRLAVDVCAWLRPEARTSAERMFCHVHGRGKNAGQMIPGWPYSFVAALGPGASSWTAPLDAVRLGPDDDDTEVTAAQLREVAGRLASSGAWHEGDGDIIVVMDAGYDVIRLAWLLADLPLVLCARLRSNRVFWRVPAPKPPGKVPVIEGTLIQLRPGRLPGYREPKPMWLWAGVTGAAGAEVAVLWQAYLRRFDLEHTFRFFKQVLGWTAPKIRDPAAADRWTWIIIAAYTQLRLAASLAADLRLPWQRPQPPGAMTPARVRRGFRAVRETLGTPTALPRPSRPGPGRPKGSRNRHKAPRHDVGKRNLKRANRAKRKARNKTAKLNGKL